MEKEQNLKSENIEVLKKYENDKGPHRIVVRDLKTNEEGKMAYWPTLKRGSATVPNPCASVLQVGGKYRVGVWFQDGRAGYEGEWMIKSAEPLATTTEAKEVFQHENLAAGSMAHHTPQRSVPTITDRDKSIMYQSARKDAAVMEAAFLVSMGWELWEKERGWKAFKATTEDCYRMVNDLAGHGFDPFENE